MRSTTRVYSLILSVPFFLGALFCAGLIAWDPLDIRPWGDAPALSEKGYPLLIQPLLAPTQTKHEKSVVLVGSSTAIGMRNGQLSMLEDGGPAINLSMGAQRVSDSKLALSEAVKTPGLKRLVIEISHIWLYEEEASTGPGQRLKQAYAVNWYDLPSFDKEVIRAGLANEKNGLFWLDEWNDDYERIRPSGPVQLDNWQLRKIRTALRNGNAKNFPQNHASASCDQFGGIQEALDDVFVTAKQNGFAVDIYFSPIPYASYTLLAKQQRKYFSAYGFQDSFFMRLMAMHHCVAKLSADQASSTITLHAVNTNPLLVEDLRGMRDPTHFSMPFKFDYIIDDIATQRATITPQNFETYRKHLRQNIIAAFGKDLPPWQPPVESKK